MNLELFDKLMRAGSNPSQYSPEWRAFLEFCESYMKKHEIERPIVVELGSWRGRAKKFYEQFLNARYIGIDWSSKRSTPDILGDTRNPETLKKLKEKLKGEMINILFIDASHVYEDVKHDYETYSPLCSNIIALHDIELGRHQNIRTRTVWKFWDELKARVCNGEDGYRDMLILSMHQYKGTGDKSQPGTGVIVKK